MQGASLRLRLAVAMGLTFILGFAGFASTLADIRDELRTMILRSDVSRSEGLPEGAARLVYDSGGKLVSHEGAKMPDLASHLATRSEAGYHTDGTYVTISRPLGDGRREVIVRADQQEQQAVDGLIVDRLRRSLGFGLPLLVLSIATISALIWWSLRPLRFAAQLADRIGPAEADQRLPVANLPSEIRPLVLAVNGGLDRLSDAYAAQRQFVADAAHALRTPLSVLHLRVQDTAKGSPLEMSAVEADIAELRRLVDQLLLLARNDAVALGAASPAEKREINVSRLMRELVASMLPLIESQGRAFEAEIASGLKLVGDENGLTELVRIGIDNALLHGGGRISLKACRVDDTVRIDIADQGNGPPPDQRDAVFERFRKLSTDTRGAGLGLSIAREIAEQHSGRVAFQRNTGSVLEIALPIDSPRRST